MWLCRPHAGREAGVPSRVESTRSRSLRTCGPLPCPAPSAPWCRWPRATGCSCPVPRTLGCSMLRAAHALLDPLPHPRVLGRQEQIWGRPAWQWSGTPGKFSALAGAQNPLDNSANDVQPGQETQDLDVTVVSPSRLCAATMRVHSRARVKVGSPGLPTNTCRLGDLGGETGREGGR